MRNNIIPTPKKVITSDEILEISEVKIHTDEVSWQKFVNVFKEGFEKVYGISVERDKGVLELIKDDSIAKGTYILSCSDKVKMYASDNEGAAYAIASLFQLINVKDGCISVPKINIEDYSDKDYRTLMIDLARCWHPVRTIFKYIDICFMFKIKYIHLHFTDNQLYTLPSKVFPDLSTKGRSYSFDDIKRIREYAIEREITIIPEFEVPGHARPLNKAYPEVFSDKRIDKDDESAKIITEVGGIIAHDNIICGGSSTAMAGVENLIKEIAEMFPESPYIHIGGDEANIKAWGNCSVCKKYMEDNSITGVDDLYSDFVSRAAQKVLDVGRIPIVWEGFSKKGAEKIPKETIVIVWENHYHMPHDLLSEGFKIINASWQPLYIVPGVEHRWNPIDILKWNVYNWQHWWENSEAYLNPVNVAPTENVIGAQLCSWECTYDQEINIVMENSAALAEKTWNVKRICDDKEFTTKHDRLMRMIARYIQDV